MFHRDLKNPCLCTVEFCRPRFSKTHASCQVVIERNCFSNLFKKSWFVWTEMFWHWDSEGIWNRRSEDAQTATLSEITLHQNSIHGPVPNTCSGATLENTQIGTAPDFAQPHSSETGFFGLSQILAPVSHFFQEILSQWGAECQWLLTAQRQKVLLFSPHS